MTKKKIKKVLIVEDSEHYRKRAEEIVKKQGYEPFLAENGIEGVELYKNILPNYTIMDICMPIMDGIEATKEIIDFDRDAKIIICSSANFVPTYRKRAIKNGAKAFLQKNFSQEDLKQIIEEIKLEDIQ